MSLAEQRSRAESAAQSAQFPAVSRLPKHKRADPQNSRDRASPAGIDFERKSKTRRLATKPGMKLREEVVHRDRQSGEKRAVSWSESTKRWREWLREAMDSVAVFERTDEEEGEARVPLENRFMQSRREQLYAKLKDLERGIREDYGNLSTAMLTLTASNKSGAGDWWRTPANHLDDLMASWPAVRRALHRALDGRRWEYARVLEPHESGYAHAHVAIFVDGPVRESDFEPAMKAHVEHCLPASWEAHNPEEDAVNVKNGIDNLAGYLSSYVMKWGENPLEAPENVQRFNALLWATGRRRWSVSDGAQEYMSMEKPPVEGEWRLSTVIIQGEEYPVNPQGEREMWDYIDGDRGKDPPAVQSGA